MINISILFNLSLLIAISIISGFIERRCRRHTLQGKVAQGLLFGGTAVIGMLYPFVLTEGVFFDGRTIVISTCTLFFGPITGAIASLPPIALRLQLGGAGAITGVSTIVSAYLIGYIFYRIKNKSSSNWASTWNLLKFGFLVHLAMLILMALLPSKLAKETYATLTVTILVVYPLFTVLLGKILSDHETIERYIDNLQKSEQFFRQLFHKHTAIKLLVDVNTRQIIDANYSAIQFYGISREQITQMRYDDLLESKGVDITELLAQNKHEAIHRLNDGTTRHVSVLTALVDLGKESFYHLIISDITARIKAQQDKERLQKQLAQAQKLESIGLLAGGIAHDFNNIITTIVGFAHMIKLKLPEGDPLAEYANQIIQAGQKGAGLTEQILAFSKKQPLKSTILDINEHIRQLQKMLRHILRENIELKLQLHNKPLNILADSTYIDQIIINLAVNARDAMPQGGHLTIKTEHVVVSDVFADIPDFLPRGEYALIAVSDTGVGMDEETAERIFEPFFTTKEGSGTGLGLSVVYGIVKKHDGHISVNSKLNKGTTFRIYLPLSADANTAKVSEDSSENHTMLLGLSERILLAEDSEPLRRLITTILNEHGYIVTQAQDGLEAVNKFASADKKFDLVIMDAIMPKLNGIDAVHKIKAFDKDAKIILMTGYGRDFDDIALSNQLGISFLHKPLTPHSLLVSVRNTLDGVKNVS